GTRFRPLSFEVPKPLFPVAGVPMLQHHIEACVKVPNMKEILLIGFYQPNEELNRFLSSAQQEFRVSIRYLQEYAALSTGGGIYHFRDQILSGGPEAFFVMNADVCSEFPLPEMLEFQKEHDDGRSFVIQGTTANRKQSLNYGCIVENQDTNELGPNVSIGKGVSIGAGVRDHCCVLNSIVGWDSTIGKWARVEGTPSDPNPNDPYAKIDSETLFRDGKLTPSITILGVVLLGSQTCTRDRKENLSKLRELADQLEDVKQTFTARIETAEQLASNANGKATATKSECNKLGDRLAALEDGCRSNNIRIEDLPENRERPNPVKFVAELFSEIIGEDFKSDTKIAAAYHIRGSNTAKPRSLIVCFERLQFKLNVMTLLRHKQEIIFENNHIHICPDFLPSTPAKCAAFYNIKQQLQKANIRYSLLYPAKLKVDIQDRYYIFSSKEEEEKELRKLIPTLF
ncbi:GMPAA guanyltransferase, partial [Polypterus senegalus]